LGGRGGRVAWLVLCVCVCLCGEAQATGKSENISERCYCSSFANRSTLVSKGRSCFLFFYFYFPSKISLGPRYLECRFEFAGCFNRCSLKSCPPPLPHPIPGAPGATGHTTKWTKFFFLQRNALGVNKGKSTSMLFIFL
jgi:hypothetical protein